MSSYALFLDDECDPADVKWVDLPAANWVIVRSYAEFTSTIRTRGCPAHVSFDHDLGPQAMAAAIKGARYEGGEKTGYDCAKWLVAECFDHGWPFPLCTVHSLNPIGRTNIEQHLQWAVDYRESEKEPGP